MKKNTTSMQFQENIILNKKRLHPPGAIEEQYVRMSEDLKLYWGEEPDMLDEQKVEAVNCSLCGTPPPPVETAIFRKLRFPYLRCPFCSLVYPSPRPKMNHIEQQYKKGRFSSSFCNIYLPSAKYRMETIFRERVENIIMPRVPTGRLLDVGCSSGHFLKVAYDHGFEVYGIEPNPDMVEFATEELGLPNINEGVLKDDAYVPNYFDVITLWDVLEHVENPCELLHMCHKYLNHGGWIFAYTENLESFNYFMTESDSEMFTPDVHLRHYSPKTFRMEFEKAGFTVRQVMTKGLDVRHIETTVNMNPSKYPIEELQVMLENADDWQSVINICGKGDNLRLFAQK